MAMTKLAIGVLLTAVDVRPSAKHLTSPLSSTNGLDSCLEDADRDVDVVAPNADNSVSEAVCDLDMAKFGSEHVMERTTFWMD